MCEPMTIAAIGVAAVGAAKSAMDSSAHGAAVRNIAQLNASVSERQASDAIQRGLVPEMRERMHGSQFIGVQNAHYSASGVLVGVGSAGDVTQQTRMMSDLDEEIIRNNAAREAYGFRTEAQRYRQEGEYGVSSADNAATSSVIGGVGKMTMIGAQSWMERPAGEG